jgi:hypothetical protein
MSRNEVLALLMENISYPPTEFDAQESQSNAGGYKSDEGDYGINHRDFMPVLSLSHIWFPKSHIAMHRNRLSAISWEPSKAIAGPNSGALLFRLLRCLWRPCVGIERS